MEPEIRKMRKDLAKFRDWAKQSQASNWKNLSILNDNFKQLLKLFISKTGAVGLENSNLQHVAITSRGGNKVEKKRKSVRKDLPIASYEIDNYFSDVDEDIEDSLKINPISLNTFRANVETSTDKIKRRKSSIYEHNSVADEKLTQEKDNKLTSQAIKEVINTKSMSTNRGGRCSAAKFTGKKFEQNLRALKRKRDGICKKFPNIMKLPDSYLEYGAARGWHMSKIRMKFYKHRKKLELQTLNSTTCNAKKKSMACLKKRNSSIERSSPVLNLTPVQLEANLKALREEHENSKRKRPIPDYYFKFGAARGWSLRQVAQKYSSICYKNKIRSSAN